MATATYAAGGDTCLGFFSAAWPGLFDVPQGARVLEIGCAEADWIGPMKAVRPDLHLTGIDWRACTRAAADVLVQGDVLSAERTFAPESFDAVVCISSLEHIGLGHYDADPIHAAGDVACVDRVHTWLKPGGLLYFDVPWNPDPGYRVIGTKTRVYDDLALSQRLKRRDAWETVARRYIPMPLTPAVFGPRPTTAHPQFHYAVCVWRKPVRLEYLG